MALQGGSQRGDQRDAVRGEKNPAGGSGGPSREPWFQPPESDRLDAEEATRALAGLPIEQRETIVFRLWGGLSFEQIAEVTGCSTSSVHRWYQKGLAALRERLGEECPEKKEPEERP